MRIKTAKCKTNCESKHQNVSQNVKTSKRKSKWQDASWNGKTSVKKAKCELKLWVENTKWKFMMESHPGRATVGVSRDARSLSCKAREKGFSKSGWVDRRAVQQSYQAPCFPEGSKLKEGLVEMEEDFWKEIGGPGGVFLRTGWGGPGGPAARLFRVWEE